LPSKAVENFLIHIDAFGIVGKKGIPPRLGRRSANHEDIADFTTFCIKKLQCIHIAHR
jgi:hypothetical protein